MRNYKHWIILTAGVIGVLLVVYSPRWFYPAHPLMPQEKAIGYRPITNPPQPLTVIIGKDGRKYIYKGREIEARIDNRDLSFRVALIVGAVVLGLLMLRAKEGQNKTGSINVEATGGKSVEGTPNKGMHRSRRSELLIHREWRSAAR